MSVGTEAPPRPPAVGPLVDRGFRRDIEGLRAVAVGGVVLYHAGFGSFTGGFVGVDVFYVVSGFLITSLLVQPLLEGGTIGILGFYARRIRRLLPASAFVLVVTTIVAYFVMAPLARLAIVDDVPYAALYVSNIRFAVRALDYLGSDRPSTVLHYWSLAVEEQFYFVWPLVVAIVTRKWGIRGLLRAVALVVAGSFVLSVVLTGVRQPWAFFSLPARAWELGVGALLALTASRLPAVRGVWRDAAAVVGLGGIAAAMLLYDDRTLFPGFAALVPVLGTALVIASGTGGTTAAGWLLGRRPLVRLGRWSYALYLWHWPLLVLAEGDGRRPPSVGLRWSLVALSVVLAGLTFRFVEVPVRNARSLVDSWRRCAILGIALTLLALGVALATRGVPALHTDRVAGPATDVGLDYVPSDVTPSLRGAEGDVPPIYDGCHAELTDRRSAGCVYGDAGAARTIVLFGDSKAAQWFPAFEEIARTDGWRLVLLTKSACPSIRLSVFNELLGRAYEECDAFRDDAMRRIAAMDHPVVVLSNSRDYTRAGDEGVLQRLIGATVATIDELDDADVVVLGDSPRPGFLVPICLSAHLDDALACAPTRAEAVDPKRTDLERYVAVAGGARFVDTTDWICPDDEVCRVLAGRLLVYRDRTHITATFARSLAPRVRTALG